MSLNMIMAREVRYQRRKKRVLLLLFLWAATAGLSFALAVSFELGRVEYILSLANAACISILVYCWYRLDQDERSQTGNSTLRKAIALFHVLALWVYLLRSRRNHKLKAVILCALLIVTWMFVFVLSAGIGIVTFERP